jgi:hypothetical protein
MVLTMKYTAIERSHAASDSQHNGSMGKGVREMGRGPLANPEPTMNAHDLRHLACVFQVARAAGLQRRTVHSTTMNMHPRNKGRMRQTLKLYVLRNAGDSERDAVIIFSHTMDLTQAKRLAREVAGICNPECEEYQLPDDFDAGKLSGVGLRAYRQLIS